MGWGGWDAFMTLRSSSDDRRRKRERDGKWDEVEEMGGRKKDGNGEKRAGEVNWRKIDKIDVENLDKRGLATILMKF